MADWLFFVAPALLSAVLLALFAGERVANWYKPRRWTASQARRGKWLADHPALLFFGSAAVWSIVFFFVRTPSGAVGYAALVCGALIWGAAVAVTHPRYVQRRADLFAVD